MAARAAARSHNPYGSSSQPTSRHTSAASSQPASRHPSDTSYSPYRVPVPIPRSSYTPSTSSYGSYPGSYAGSQPNLNNNEPADEIGLKKNLGLVSGTALIVGTMIGSGIFISPKGVTEGSGSVGLSLISWLICGIISLFAAISYAELGTLIPRSGAEYSYLLEAYGPLQRFVGPLPAFLFNWMNMLLLKPAAVAIICLAFAVYAIEPVFDLCDQPETATKCLAALAILVLCIINCFSVRLATIVQNVFTVLKLLAIVIIVIGGFVKLGQGRTRYLATGFADTETSVSKITIGLYKGMWAFDGWNNLNYVTEELVNPYVNLPRSIFIGIPLVTVCYLLVNISYFSVMSVSEMVESPAVAVMWGNRVLGPMWWIIPVFVACSCLGAANGTLFSGGRLSYAAGRKGHNLELFSMIHVKRYTPLPSIVLTSLIALIMVIPGNIDGLIDFFNFAVWFFYGGTMAALLVMRWTHKDVVRPFKVPIVFPIIVLIASVWLVVAPIIEQPRIEFLYVFLFVLSGLIFYIPFVYFNINVPCMEPLTEFMQLLMEVSPPSEEPES